MRAQEEMNALLIKDMIMEAIQNNNNHVFVVGPHKILLRIDSTKQKQVPAQKQFTVIFPEWQRMGGEENLQLVFSKIFN